MFRLFAGVLSRSLGMEDVVFGKLATGRAKGQTVLLVDLDSETAHAVLDRLQKPPPAVVVDVLVEGVTDGLVHTDIEAHGKERVALPEGLKIEACRTLPEIMLDRSPTREYSSGRGSRGGGGGGGGRSFSAAGRGAGGGGGRSWQRSGDSGGGGRSWGGGGAPDRGGGRSSTASSGARGTWDRPVHRTGGRGH